MPKYSDKKGELTRISGKIKGDGGGGSNGGKIIIQRLNKEIYCQETLYKAHGADASKADYA